MTATKSEAENVASVVTFTAFYQDIPALSISWLSPFPPLWNHREHRDHGENSTQVRLRRPFRSAIV